MLCPRCRSEEAGRHPLTGGPDLCDNCVAVASRAAAQVVRSGVGNPESLLRSRGVPLRYLQADLGQFPVDVGKAVKQSLAENRGVVVSGAVGGGKTHLLCAIARYLLFDLCRGCYFIGYSEAVDRLRGVNELNDPTVRDQAHQLRNLMCGVSFLLLDDLFTSRGSAWEMEAMYLILNDRYNARLPVCVSYNPTSTTADDRLLRRVLEGTAEVRL